MILNIHPSLLPRYRGANPYMAVLQAGESETGITVHQVTTGIDSGPILAQERVFIDSYDTGGSLQRRCAEAMHRLLPRILNQLAQVYPAWEKLPWHAQNEAFKSTCKALSLGDGAVDWQDSPEQIRNRVRAIQPWLPAYTFAKSWAGPLLLAFTQVKITTAPVIKNEILLPGAILCLAGVQGLTVQGSAPDTQLILTGVRLYAWIGYLPVWLSGLALKSLLRPGTQLRPPNQRLSD